ncbi:MAG: HAMP domain-containing histidine kinase [Kordiimonadaceae bacterium]|nr:HAMP domain-containing histidine kinase [Kordiimonadaceae bacterium]MBO6568717.1 HAMP domain-containing histidine kinase [Kordiimonadaceae bacterium]MBO6965307.1 HAMP domain-containing histidine kinase [Kordiimonadaceae bacterium]
MSQKSRRIRSMIMRTFLGAMITSFSIFSFLVVIFVFSTEDEIFDLLVDAATTEFIAENPIPVKNHGSLKSLNMTYYVDTDDMPAWLQAEIDPTYTDGQFEVFGEENGHFHALVRPLADGRSLYVFFNARRFIRSTPQIKYFLVLISVMAGIGILLSLLALARMSRKVSSPMEDVARILADGGSVVDRLRIPPDAPKELHALARAIEERDGRIQALIERERQFNRDASHELRTPLAVAFGAAEVLEEKEMRSKALTRLKSAIKDMQQLTEGILWLGRDPETAQSCPVAQVCERSIEAYGHLVADRNVVIRLEGPLEGDMPVPEPVALVMIGNILRNALSYTEEGEVVIEATNNSVRITDTGVGFGEVDPDKEGFGVGLTLVERLCRHFEIVFALEAREGGGTVAMLTWREGI